jgi:hypothetical protein
MAGEKRPLTAGEIEFLDEVFDGKVDYGRVTLHDGPGSNPFARLALRQQRVWAMTYRSAIHFNKGRYSRDFSAPGGDRRLLVHELVHVWQYAKLGLPAFAVRYGWNYLTCDCDPNRTYEHVNAAHFNDATLEGQASIVEEYFGRRTDAGLKAKLARTGFFGL